MVTFILELIKKGKAYHGLQESVPNKTCLIFQIEEPVPVGVNSTAFLHHQLFQVRSQHRHEPLQKKVQLTIEYLEECEMKSVILRHGLVTQSFFSNQEVG
jgi:hypothetical protein